MKPTSVISVRGRLHAELMADPSFLYVGRQCFGWPQSKWHNPFYKGMSYSEVRYKFGYDLDSIKEIGYISDGYQSVFCFANWFICNSSLRDFASELKGKILGCWCQDFHPEFLPTQRRNCHAIYLAKFVNGDPNPLRRIVR